jgi:hypothetical protein
VSQGNLVVSKAVVLIAVLSLLLVACESSEESPYNYPINKASQLLQRPAPSVEGQSPEPSGTGQALAAGAVELDAETGTEGESSNPGELEGAAPPGEEMPDTLFPEVVELPFHKEIFAWVEGDRRDPFKPLIGEGVTEGAGGLNVNNVSLVGTMWGPEGMLALVRERGGTGHVLREGDKVAGGRVASITQDSITFVMTQFGFVTEITFHLKE